MYFFFGKKKIKERVHYSYIGKSDDSATSYIRARMRRADDGRRPGVNRVSLLNSTRERERGRAVDINAASAPCNSLL